MAVIGESSNDAIVVTSNLLESVNPLDGNTIEMLFLQFVFHERFELDLDFGIFSAD